MGLNYLLQSACLKLTIYVSRQHDYLIRYKNVFFLDFDEQEYEIKKHNGDINSARTPELVKDG